MLINKLTNLIGDTVVFFLYPPLCPVCGRQLMVQEKQLCLVCRSALPWTGYEFVAGNPVDTRFWGRIRLDKAASALFFTKGGSVQKILHQIKYENNRDLARYMGRITALKLRGSGFFSGIDVITAVPLDSKKKQLRGYNQSEVFAKGLADVCRIRSDFKILSREKRRESQTRKGRFARWENMKEVFVLKRRPAQGIRHILLVDDVVTTGATLEACSVLLAGEGDIKISVLTLACA